MNESLNQSMSVKKASKRIKKVKIKYINFSILLLIINFITFFVQKFPELNDNEKDPKIMTKNIFLLFEDFGLKVLIIISLIKFKINSIILFSILYFIIVLVMIFYLIFNKLSNKIDDKLKIEKLSFAFFIVNIAFFALEGFLLAKISQLMIKEKREKRKEKYGFNSNEEMLRSKNILVENSF